MAFHALEGGYQILYEFDDKAMPPDDDPGLPLKRTEVLNGEDVKASKMSSGGPYVIEILMLYTDEVTTSNLAGIRSNIEDTFDDIIYNHNNGVNDNRELEFSVKIVVTEEATPYSEDGKASTALNWLAGTWAQGRHTDMGTDILLLIHGNTLKGTDPLVNICGAANPSFPVSSAAGAYAVIAESCALSGETVPHEIGHLIGANHHLEAMIQDDANYDPDNANPSDGHAFCDYDAPYRFRTVNTNTAGATVCEYTRIEYWSSTADEHLSWSVGLNDSGADGEYQDVELLWNNKQGTVAGWANPPANLPVAFIEGPSYADYHEVYTLYGDSGIYYPRGDSTGDCSTCTYKWYEREPGSSWYYTSVTTANYLASLLSYDGYEYKLVVTKGADSGDETHFVEYCDDCPSPKRGYSNQLGDDSAVPEVVTLNSAYPNPFNPSTVFSFALPEGSDASIEIFDVLGRKIHTVTDGWFEAGSHEVFWTAPADMPSGTYMYRLASGHVVLTQMITLLR